MRVQPPQNFSRAGVAYIICRNNTSTYWPIAQRFWGTELCGCTRRRCKPIYIGEQLGAGKNCQQFNYKYNVRQLWKSDRCLRARAQCSKNSAFDQWAEGNENAMTTAQKRGLKVFIGKGNCIHCHSGSNFSDGSFHNLGVPQVGGALGVMDEGRYTGIADLTTGANSTFNTNSSFNATPSVRSRLRTFAN